MVFIYVQILTLRTSIVKFNGHFQFRIAVVKSSLNDCLRHERIYNNVTNLDSTVKLCEPPSRVETSVCSNKVGFASALRKRLYLHGPSQVFVVRES